MTEAILIGKAITEIAKNDAGLTAAIADRLYPIAAVEGAAKPYVTYQRLSVTPDDCKDGLLDDGAGIGFVVVASDYLTSAHVAQALRRAFTFRRRKAAGMVIDDCALASISEDYVDADGAFIQKLQFNCNIPNLS